MTTDTEALRAQFERRMNLRGWSEANIRRDGLDYSSTQLTEAWHAFQAGHAAAKAETAAPVVGRWYFVTNDGAATLCVDEADARESAAEADIAFPIRAPHRAVQLVPADQLAAAVAAATETTLRAAQPAPQPAAQQGKPSEYPPEFKTEREHRAYCFGWWKALEVSRRSNTTDATLHKAIGLAYGWLWHATTSDPRIHAARAALLGQLSRDDQRAGIRAARAAGASVDEAALEAALNRGDAL